MSKYKLCKRGVLYVTPVCNLKCRFCYYRFIKERQHPPIFVLKQEADRLRFEYELEAVDLTGYGEPTTYPLLNELVEYCDEIGLKPTTITNGQLTPIIQKLINEGHIDDFLVSVHDIGKDYDYLVDVKGSWERLKKTLNLLKEQKMKFRTNTTITKLNLPRLKEIIKLVSSYGSRIHNFIIFNPHEGTDWADKMNVTFQAKYSEIEKPLKEAIDYANEIGLWVNVRYMPLCMMKGYEQHVCNFHQWIYDPYEWEEGSGNNIHLKTEEDYISFVKKKVSVNHFKKECENCANREICDGIYPQYVKRFGDSEFIPKKGEKIKHPLFYRGKYVEEYSK